MYQTLLTQHLNEFQLDSEIPHHPLADLPTAVVGWTLETAKTRTVRRTHCIDTIIHLSSVVYTKCDGIFCDLSAWCMSAAMQAPQK